MSKFKPGTILFMYDVDVFTGKNDSVVGVIISFDESTKYYIVHWADEEEFLECSQSTAETFSSAWKKWVKRIVKIKNGESKRLEKAS